MTQEEAKYILEHTVISWSVSGSDAREAIQMAIKELKRKHGKWEWNNDDELFYSCSCCGHKAYGNTLEIIDGTYHFCPNCGAEMKGEE